DEHYSKEDVDRLRKELMAVTRRRMLVETKVSFLQEESELESMCRIGGQPEDMFRERCARICKLCKKAMGYLQQEIDAYKRYVDASWLYQMETGKSL
ncbi:MAG: hypothetical protein NTW67_06735, partial [Candidatus Woesearchaeota archaeon]|nr:hypothetical protein [Candidatus Woesearchaeota archaeon]